MTRQMSAERSRRAVVTEAEGQKSAAVTVARVLGVDTIALPTAGNAGGAAAAYAARAGLRCVIAMPSDTPAAIVLECRAFGADVHLLVTDFQPEAAAGNERLGLGNFAQAEQAAVELPGLLLGWSPFLRGKVRAQAAKGLASFERAPS